MVGGAAEVKAHPFFRHVDWKELRAKRLPVPWQPTLKSALDTSNFDRACTQGATSSSKQRQPAQSHTHTHTRTCYFLAPSPACAAYDEEDTCEAYADDGTGWDASFSHL